MGRFIGLSKNRGSGLAIEDPDFLNSGLILTSNGTGFVLAGGASLDRDPLPDFINANESLNESLQVTGAFGDSTYTFAWKDGSQYGLSLSSSGTLSGSAGSMPAATTLSITVTDTKYNRAYDVDLEFIVSTGNTYPKITEGNNTITISGGETHQFSYSGSPVEWSIVTRGNLPGNVTLSNSGLMTFPGKSGDNTNTNYNFTLGVRSSDMPASSFRTVSFSKNFYFESVTGQQQYQGVYGQAGGTCSYNWVAPTGVTQVHVMAMGAGGGGRYSWASCGGHGGGMVWANNIPVSPGSSYCIQVGRGGCWSG